MAFDLKVCYDDLMDGEVISTFKGNVTTKLINSVLEDVEEKLDADGVNPKIKRRIYNVLVEGLQNLFHHADIVPSDFDAPKDEKFGVFILNKVDDEFRITTGNFIHKDKIKLLRDKMDKINSLTKEELKDLYKFILNHQRINVKGGGGLGLIDIAKKTGNKLSYTFTPYNDKYYFYNLNIKTS